MANQFFLFAILDNLDFFPECSSLKVNCSKTKIVCIASKKILKTGLQSYYIKSRLGINNFCFAWNSFFSKIKKKITELNYKE